MGTRRGLSEEAGGLRNCFLPRLVRPLFNPNTPAACTPALAACPPTVPRSDFVRNTVEKDFDPEEFIEGAKDAYHTGSIFYSGSNVLWGGSSHPRRAPSVPASPFQYARRPRLPLQCMS